MATEHFKVAIVGAGPGGVSCAMSLLEARIPALLIDKNLNCGGQLSQIPSPILNFAGTNWQNGNAAQKALEQSLIEASHDALSDDCLLDVRCNVTVTGLTSQGVLTHSSGTYSADYLVLAPGYRLKQLLFAGPPEALEHVHYHSSKALLSREEAVVVGGGDSALLECLTLLGRGKKVSLIARSDLSKARPDLQSQIKDSAIDVYLHSQISRLEADQDGLCSIVVNKLKEQKTVTVPCQFVVVKAGYQPNTEFVRGVVNLDESGHIMVNHSLNVMSGAEALHNIFALGDAAATVAHCPRIARAVGQGMQVATAISNLLAQRK